MFCSLVDVTLCVLGIRANCVFTYDSGSLVGQCNDHHMHVFVQSGKLPEQWGQLKNLQHLDLGGNNLSG